MTVQNLKSKLHNLQENISLANNTTFRIGGPAKYFISVREQKDFVGAIRAAKENDLPFFVLGGGSNLLVADEGFDGLVIKNQSSKIKIKNLGEKLKIECDAGVPLGRIILESTQNGFGGAEWGFGIPGTIGGAIFGNAGRLGQSVSQVVEKIRVLDKNLNLVELDENDCGFGYRESRFKKSGEVIIEAVLKFQKKEETEIDNVLAEAKQVIKHSSPYPSAGCVFKNYVVQDSDLTLKNHPELAERVRGGKIGVGYLIEQCGLKGRRVGQAQIWEGHANYFVNLGGARAADVLRLIELAKDAVCAKYGIILEEEIRLLK